MRPSRKHAEILLASLVFVGSVMWTMIIGHHVLDFDRVVRALLWCAAGFTGAQVVKRWLVRISTGELTISALVAWAGVIGAIWARASDPPSVRMVLPLVAVEAGALLGAWTSRRTTRADLAAPVHSIWRVLGAGFCGYGALVLTTGVSLQVSDDDQLLTPALLSTLLAGTLVVRFTSARPANCALGMALIGASAAASNVENLSIERAIGTVMVIFAVGAGLGAVGGCIGRWLRPKQEPTMELPEAQVR